MRQLPIRHAYIIPVEYRVVVDVTIEPDALTFWRQPYMSAKRGFVDQCLAEGIESVSGDVQRTTRLTLTIYDEDWTHEAGTASAMFGLVGGGVSGLRVHIADPLGDRAPDSASTEEVR